MTDIWACSNCHSINRQRNATCYKCGAKQQDASDKIADVRTEQAILSRAVTPYRRSILRALVAALFIAGYAVLSVVVLIESIGVWQFMRDQVPAMLQGDEMDAETTQELLRLVAPAVVPALLKSIFSIGALLFFAAWLSRVVMNIPALGGGMPNTTPTKAFIYPLIPFWNLLKTPPMIQNALYRLDPKAGGFFMVLVAWVGLVGSAIVSFFAGWWVNLRIATVAPRSQTLGDAIAVVQGAFDMQFIVGFITTIMGSVGALVLVLIIFRIESRAAARDREIKRAAFAERPEPGTVEARPGAVTWDAAAASAGQTATSVAAPATPAPPAMVPGPYGFAPASASSQSFEDRPIGSALVEQPEPEPTEPAPPAAAPLPTYHAAPPVVRPAPGPPPAILSPVGPQLHLRIQDNGSMIATLEGESEAITIAELRAAATALAGVTGSAVIESATTFEALSLAEQAFDTFTNAGVRTTMKD
jgi:hypothetical protein